jgi:hypothetical protein
LSRKEGAGSEQKLVSNESRAAWIVGVYRDARKTFSFFRCFERNLEDFAVWLVFPPSEMIHFHALLAFSCLFSAFFSLWIPASLISFFSADDEFLVLSLFGILLYFEAMGDFAMLC